MYIIYFNEEFDKEHLEKVKEEIKVSNTAPIVHVFWNGEVYTVLEDHYKLFAAKELGFKPILRVVNEKSIIKGQDYYCDYPELVEAHKIAFDVYETNCGKADCNRDLCYYENENEIEEDSFNFKECDHIVVEIDRSKDNFILVDFQNLTYEGKIDW